MSIPEMSLYRGRTTGQVVAAKPEDSYSDQQLQAYRALSVAAERIGRNNYKSGLYRATYRNGKLTKGYSITAEHQRVIEAMPKVLTGEISPDDAMAILHEYDVFQQRVA